MSSPFLPGQGREYGSVHGAAPAPAPAPAPTPTSAPTTLKSQLLDEMGHGGHHDALLATQLGNSATLRTDLEKARRRGRPSTANRNRRGSRTWAWGLQAPAGAFVRRFVVRRPQLGRRVCSRRSPSTQSAFPFHLNHAETKLG